MNNIVSEKVQNENYSSNIVAQPSSFSNIIVNGAAVKSDFIARFVKIITPNFFFLQEPYVNTLLKPKKRIIVITKASKNSYIFFNDQKHDLHEGDVLLIQPSFKYCFSEKLEFLEIFLAADKEKTGESIINSPVENFTKDSVFMKPVRQKPIFYKDFTSIIFLSKPTKIFDKCLVIDFKKETAFVAHQEEVNLKNFCIIPL